LQPGINLRIRLCWDGESRILGLEFHECFRVDEDFARGRDTSCTLIKESEVFAIRAGWRAESSVVADRELKVSEGVLATDVDDGECGPSKSGFESISESGRMNIGVASCVNDGGSPRAGIDWPAAARACTTEAQPCSSTLIRSLSS